MDGSGNMATLRRRILKQTWNALRDYGMIAEGDRVLVGLSGGKDSLLLVDILAELARNFRTPFMLEAVHIGLRDIPYAVSRDYLSGYCAERQVTLHYRDVAFEQPLATDEAGVPAANPCFLCSWTRRKTLFNTAQELNCTRLALGHHLDDVLETLLMNQVFQGSFSTIPPVLQMHKFRMTIIRPFYRVTEADLAELAGLCGLKRQKKACPYEKASHRADIKQILGKLTAMNPEVRQSMFKAMSNIQYEYLPPNLRASAPAGDTSQAPEASILSPSENTSSWKPC
ncbi:MAG: tRNA 2-thiocytidine(32) synthetase TtcA [Bacteroidales bacterium]|nr:tRNA 2-thiocytidine(32) synthetase TtcA [Bacteroidales bacterium]